jgi:hypothetical protein
MTMGIGEIIKEFGALIVASAAALGLLAEKIWKARRQNSTAYDLSAVKRERAFREEVFKLMDRKDKDYDDLKADFIKLAKDHLSCATELAAVKARLDFAERQLDQLLTQTRKSEPETIIDIKKGK